MKVEKLYLKEDITWSQLLNKSPELANQWKNLGLNQQDFESNKFNHWNDIKNYISQKQGENISSEKDAINKIKSDFIKPEKNASKELAVYVRDKLNLSNAAKVLEKFDPKFLRVWLNAFKWPNLNTSNSFLKMLNKPEVDSIIDGKELIFSKFYNACDYNDSNDILNSELILYKDLYRIRDQEEINALVSYELTNPDINIEAMKADISQGSYDKYLGNYSSKKAISKIKNEKAIKDANKVLANIKNKAAVSNSINKASGITDEVKQAIITLINANNN